MTTNSKLKDLLGDIKELPPMPQVAMEVLGILDKEDYSFAELVSIITKDVSITASILKLANSPLFGSRVPINNLTQAISLIGVTNLKNLVIALSTKGLFESNKIGVFEQKLWEHSVATAIYAKLFALKYNRKYSEEAFILGLLHDLGQTILSIYLEKYHTVKEIIFGETVNVLYVEREFLGFDHCEIGSLLLNEWGLPELYSNVIMYHHNPEKSKFSALAQIIFIANNKVKEHGYTISTWNDEGFKSVLEQLGIEESELSDLDLNFLDLIKNEKELLKL
ncbi:MAG: HDOD domain-containing protein [Deferribacterales bacterium]